MAKVYVETGYDKRCWVTWQVKDATPEEIEILDGNEDDALELVRQLDAADRLEYVSENQDDNPDYFSEYASPGVIGTREEEDD